LGQKNDLATRDYYINLATQKYPIREMSNLYGRGLEDIGGGDDLFFVEEKTEVKQGGFQPMIDFKNKFSFSPVMTHFKAAPRLLSVGTLYSYGITETGELLCWTTEEDRSGMDKNSNIDLKSLSSEGRDGLIGKTTNFLNNMGKDKPDQKKATFTNLYSSHKGDFCIFTTLEGDNYIYIHRTKSIEVLPKLRRTLTALKFIDVLNEDERSVVKLVCSSTVGFFSSATLEFKFKTRDKVTRLDNFDMTVNELNQHKLNAAISKIDVGDG